MIQPKPKRLPKIDSKPCPRRKTYHVIDAKTPLKFEVTWRDLRGSRVGDANNCAGACALKRQTGGDVWVKRSITFIAHGKKAYRYLNPRNLSKAVDKFDATGGLFPVGEYVLRPVPKSIRMEEIDKYNRTRPTTGKEREQARMKTIKHRKRPVYTLR